MSGVFLNQSSARSTTHIHLDDQNCLEILAVNGEVKTTRSLAEKLIR